MARVKEKKTEEAAIKIKFFYIRTGRPEEFVDKLEELCRTYCPGNEFFFKYSVEG